MRFGIHNPSWVYDGDAFAGLKTKAQWADYGTIEKSHNNSWLLARDAAAVAAKRERLSARGPLRGFVGTVAEAIDLIGRYRDVGVDLLINSDYRNDIETHELMASEVVPHFA